MRSLLFIAAALLAPASAAWPCAAPPPMRSVLELVTAPDATLPADGAIVVSRKEVYASADQPDEQWKLKDGEGRDVAFTVEDLGSSVERWVPVTPGDRELDIFNETGKQIATLHQTKAKSAQLSAPKVTSLTATTSLADAHAMRMGVPGGTMTLVLGGDAPADARFLTIAITGTGARVHSAIAPTAHQRKFTSTTYAHKSCARGGPEAIFIGEHVTVTWVDGLGRRSAAVQVAAMKQH